MIGIDAAGYWWRVYEGEYWSMVPVNSDNTPIPQPVRLYKLTEIGTYQQEQGDDLEL